MKWMLKFAAAALLGMSVWSTPTLAEFPEKDIRTIVPWGAGGGVDSITRKLMSIAEDAVPTAIYVENIEGGITSIGIDRLMSAEPDGQTIGALSYDSIVSVPWQKMLPDYDLDRLTYLARVTSEANALLVRCDSKYKSYKELIEAAKAAPNKIKVGDHGPGSVPHLSILQLEEATGAQFRSVSYPSGAGGQIEALLSGELDVAVTSLGDFSALLKAGDACGILEFSEERNPAFPTVPISSDVGLDIQDGSFVLLAVPKGTPESVVVKLESIIQDAYKSEEFQTWTTNAGVTPSWLGRSEVGEWVTETQSRIFQMLQKLKDQGQLK